MENNYIKNKYYTQEDVKKARQLCKDFYKKTYTPNLLVSGNLKLGKNVLIFDIPSIVTCKYSCNKCYALKSEMIYPNVRLARAFHYEIIKAAIKDNNKLEYLKNYIQIELDRHKLLYKLPVVRIHSSGDFFSTEYLNIWLDLIRLNPDINFYTYTKIFSNDTIDKINNMYDNFNIVKSLIDNKYINYGDLEYINKLANKLDKENKPYYICKYGFKDSKDKCMGNCTACLNCPNIIFKQH